MRPRTCRSPPRAGCRRACRTGRAAWPRGSASQAARARHRRRRPRSARARWPAGPRSRASSGPSSRPSCARRPRGTGSPRAADRGLRRPRRGRRPNQLHHAVAVLVARGHDCLQRLARGRHRARTRRHRATTPALRRSAGSGRSRRGAAPRTARPRSRPPGRRVAGRPGHRSGWRPSRGRRCRSRPRHRS